METPIKIDRNNEGSVIVYELSGELDETNVVHAFGIIHKDLWDPAGKQVILHMPELTYMNSRAIGYLADLYAVMDGKWGMLKLRSLHSDVEDTLDIVGLLEVVEVVKYKL